jgi:glycerophosphoryl diester phosphodiesterase
MSRPPTLPLRGVCAHRGGAAGRPENTLAAFEWAAALGAHQIELDVRRTADGEIVVMHDESVDRTTNGEGRVSERSLAELRQLDAGSWWHGRFQGERIPTLVEVLAVVPPDVWLNIQIKRGEPLAAEVSRLVLEAGRLSQVLLACGNEAARTTRAVHPELRVCNLVRQRTREAYVDHAIATRADFIQFHHIRGPMEPVLASRCHAAGLRVNFFCRPRVTPAELRAYFEAGVDFVMVDDVRSALDIARGLGIEPLHRRPRPSRPVDTGSVSPPV